MDICENDMFDISFYKNRKVLITGHTGFKGAWMCQLLIMAGADVTGYALEPPTDPSLFEICGLKQRMRSVTGDIRDLAHMKKVFAETDPEILKHFNPEQMRIHREWKEREAGRAKKMSWKEFQSGMADLERMLAAMCG